MLKLEERAIPVTSCDSLRTEDYADMIKVYHISDRRLCHASRSSGPKDNFSTGQALNDLKDGLAAVQGGIRAE